MVTEPSCFLFVLSGKGQSKQSKLLLFQFVLFRLLSFFLRTKFSFDLPVDAKTPRLPKVDKERTGDADPLETPIGMLKGKRGHFFPFYVAYVASNTRKTEH